MGESCGIDHVRNVGRDPVCRVPAFHGNLENQGIRQNCQESQGNWSCLWKKILVFNFLKHIFLSLCKSVSSMGAA